jgi:hypothetical protein
MLELLRDRLLETWAEWPRRRFHESWLRRSLEQGAKVWIRQRMWSYRIERQPLIVELGVESWLAHANSKDRNVRKKVKLGALCPREFSIEVKGAFLTPEGLPAPNPKEVLERAHHIHSYGFT